MNSHFLDFKLIQITHSEKILAQCSGTLDKGIFISYPALDREMTDFLAKILSAVNLNLKMDVLSLEKTLENDFSFSHLNGENKIKKVLLFGIHPNTVGLQINAKKYQPFSINNCLFLLGDDLTTISQNQPLKKLLWTALKEMF